MKVNYYAVVNKRGNLITVDGRLPIFWNKEPAIRFRNRFSVNPECKVISVKIDELKELIYFEHLLH